MMKETVLTGYPSIDKPWLKYYSEEAINVPLPEKTLYQYIYDNNKDFLRNTALDYFGKKISYGVLFENVEKVAKSFSAMGIKKGDIVTIMSMHTPETIYCIYALNRLGAVANMIYLTLSEQEIVTAVKTTKSKVLVVLSVALEKINKVYEEMELEHVIVVTPSDSMKAAMRLGYKLKTRQGKLSKKYISYSRFISMGIAVAGIKDAPYNKAEPAVIVYTSGSTGEPKGVMLSNYNLNAVAHQYKVSGMQFERGDTFFNMLPPFVGFGVSVGMNLPLALGMEEILWILPDKENVARGFSKSKPNHFVSGPAMLDGIMKTIKTKMDFLTTFAGGGESISVEKEDEVNRFLINHGANVKYVTGYGMTEFGATVCTGMNHVYKLGTLGIPLPAVIVKIVNPETLEELKYNEVGEICFNAPNTMLGYFKNTKASMDVKKKHLDGIEWLHTGDLGMVDEDGFVYFKGRMKRIYVTRTKEEMLYKIFPTRVEELFRQQLYISDCGTIAIQDEEKINVLVSFVTLKNKNNDEDKVVEKLMNYAKMELPEHSVPAKIMVVKEIPLTQSGKTDYRALEQMVD